jgi:anti-sigma factor RsiW
MHGYLDSELDLVGDLEVERHIEECPQCAGSDAGGPAESATGQIGISYARKAGSPCGANQ